jgi:hypothetical protein
MADRFWRGGTGNWNNTAFWSTSDGGGGGASVPGTGDDVYFTANSNTGTGSFTVTVNVDSGCRSFTASGLDGTMTLGGSSQLSVYGSMSLPASNFTWSHTGVLLFATNSTSKTINMNGKTAGGAVEFANSGGPATDTWQLSAAFATSGAVTYRAGTLDINGYSFTAASLASVLAETKTLTFGSGGSIVLTGTGTVWNYSGSNLTISDTANANITLTNTTATARTFAGGDLTYGTLSIGGSTGTSTLTITGSNTFAAIASTKTVAHTIAFTDSTTQTVGAWSVAGTVGNVVTLQGSSTAGWNIAYTGTYVPEQIDYLSISRSTATPAGVWFAGENSVNGGNNSGWIFQQSPDEFMGFF